MLKKLNATIISAYGLAGLQASTLERIESAKVLVACRQAQAAAVIKRAENFEAIASSLRDEAADLRDEAVRAEKWAVKLEKTLA